MIDSNWELADGEVAHEIEVLNYSNQVRVIEALVRLLMHHHGVGDSGCNGCPTVMVLKEFHRTATLFLLRMPGQFRGAGEDVSVFDGNGNVVHEPPKHPEFEPYLDAFFAELLERWAEFDHVAVAAFTLWFINWVHPFKNGNGRTARAFSYACMSLKMGFIIPGTPTVIDLVMQNRREYEAALHDADAGFVGTGKPDLARMETFIEDLLIQQLSSVPED
jgi:Fic family protein